MKKNYFEYNNILFIVYVIHIIFNSLNFFVYDKFPKRKFVLKFDNFMITFNDVKYTYIGNII